MADLEGIASARERERSGATSSYERKHPGKKSAGEGTEYPDPDPEYLEIVRGMSDEELANTPDSWFKWHYGGSETRGRGRPRSQSNVIAQWRITPIRSGIREGHYYRPEDRLEKYEKDYREKSPIVIELRSKTGLFIKRYSRFEAWHRMPPELGPRPNTEKLKWANRRILQEFGHEYKVTLAFRNSDLLREKEARPGTEFKL